jgi:imidazolonepropionase-like amidohydrolase
MASAADGPPWSAGRLQGGRDGQHPPRASPVTRVVIATFAGLALLALLATAAWSFRAGFLDLTVRRPFIVAASAQLPADAGALAFVDVTVVPMDGERLLGHHTVVVQQGVVVALGPTAEVALPEDALVVDGRGRFLMPGLADMHVHVEEVDELLLFVANGVTTVRNMWGNRGAKRLLGLPDQLDLRDRIDRGELLGPTIYTAGPILEGRPAANPFMTVVTTPARAEREVARQAARGYDFIKVYDNLTPEVFQAIVEAARRHGMPVAGHVPLRVGLDAAVAGGLRTIEHLSGHLDADAAELLVDPRELADAATSSAEGAVWNTPTFVIWQKRVPTEADTSRPEMRYVSPRMQRIWRTFASYMAASIRYEGEDYAARMLALMREVVSGLHAAGAGLLLGTDTDNAYVIPGFSIHEELAHLVAAGLSPYEALRAGTAAAAEALGQPGVFGTVGVGARADLLLLEDDPLRDVGNVQRRVGVVVRGRWLPEAELRRLLEGLATSYGH